MTERVPGKGLDAMICVCQHELHRRTSMQDAILEDVDLTSLVSSTSATARQFGGFGLVRGLNPTGTATGSTLVDALYLKRSDPEALSRLVAARIAGGAPLHPSMGRYVSPESMAVVVSYDRDLAMPFISVRNVGAHMRYRYKLCPHPHVRRRYLDSAVEFLRECGKLSASSPSELCVELIPDVMMTDISDCINDVDAAIDLMKCARATGWLSADRSVWSEVHRVALSIGSNLRRVVNLTVPTVYEHVDSEAAASMLLSMSNLQPQEVPGEDVLRRMSDMSKEMLVQRGVWHMRTFDDVLALGIRDQCTTLFAANGVIVPRDWLMERARDVIRAPLFPGLEANHALPLDNDRVHALRWPLLGAWGIEGVPVHDVIEMFGDDTAGVVHIIPECVDVSGMTLTDLFRAFSELVATDAGLVRAGSAIFDRVNQKELKFPGADVRDAFKGTKVGRVLVRRDSVDVMSVVTEADAHTFGISDVCDICKRIGSRVRAMAKLAAAGATFGLADTVRTLGPKAIPFVDDGSVVATCPRDIVAACRAMVANRASKSAKGVVSLIEALRGGPGEAQVRACGRADVRAICSAVVASDRQRVSDALCST